MRLATALILVAFSCNNSQKVAFKPDYSPGPPAKVYKTRADYSSLVPVILSEDKTTIVSYPHPRDLGSDSTLSKPLLLKDGYLLDNRGISANVAFLDLSYEEYMAMKEAPTPDDLFTHILDNDPLTELCDCGNRNAFTNAEQQINEIIAAGKLHEICRVEKQP